MGVIILQGAWNGQNAIEQTESFTVPVRDSRQAFITMTKLQPEIGGGLLPARSKTVPSTADEAILAEQVEQFQNSGFTVLREVLSAAEVAEVRARLDVRMAAKLTAQLNVAGGQPTIGAGLRVCFQDS